MELEAKAPSATNLRMRLACAVLGALALLLVLAPGASATYYVHPFISEFGPDGTANSKFQQDKFIAVDQASHDVYVADVYANRIYRFTSSGAPHNFSEGEAAGRNWLTFSVPSGVPFPVIKGVAVASAGAAAGTAGDIYVAWAGASNKSPGPISWGVETYSSNGAHLGTVDGSGNPHHFPTESLDTAHPCGVAVDPAGSVYVSYCSGASEPSHVDRYVPSANPVKNANFDSEIVGLSGGYLAATGTTLYMPGSAYPLSLFPGGGGSADVGGKGTPLPATSSSEAFAVDGSSGDLYVGVAAGAGAGARPSGVRQLDEAGKELAFMAVPNSANGVGLDESSGRVYVSNFGGPSEATYKVRIYGPPVPVAPPTATIDTPSAVTYKSAHFTGTVNPGGSGEGYETTYRFQCTPSCPGLQATRQLPADGADHEVSDDASELTPETIYEVKLIATNGNGNQSVEDTTSFETAPKPPLTAPEVMIAPVSEIGPESAHLSGTVDPMGTGEGQATTYRFEYSSDGVKWIALPDQGPIEGTGPQAVSTELEGLVPNTTYSVRLHASNDGGEDTSDGPNPSFGTAAAGPQVEISPATNVLPSSAQLNGRIDPRNSQTTYYFQWGTGDCASGSCASIPASQDADAGSGAGFVSVHAQLQGLSPTTTYHYRLLAESPAGKASSGDASFTTEANPAPCSNQRVGLSVALPECRAYEMVSPLQKSGGDVASETFRTRAAADGDAITFVSQAAFAGTDGFPYSGAEYLASRDPEGWSTHSVTPLKKSPPAVTVFSGSEYVGFLTPELERGVYRSLAPNPDASANTAGADNLFLATGMRAGAPHFTLISDSVKPLGDQPFNPNGPHIAFVDASADFSHIAFEDSDNLTADASGTAAKLYEWSNGEVRLAGVLPDGACGSPPCTAAESVGGAGAQGTGYAGQGTNTQLAHAVSEDGSRVFFTAGDLKAANVGVGPQGDVGLEGSLYVRENGTHTTQVDASERSTPDPKGPGRSEFQWASPDGEEVLFLSEEELVDEDTDGEGVSLYRWRADAPAGERLTLIPTPGTVPAHVVDATSDGGFVYLLGYRSDDAAVTALYVLHGGQMRRVVTLPAHDPGVGEKGTGVEVDQARMTPDGRRLIFHSRANLTGYDPFGECGDRSATEPDKPVPGICIELYQYSYDADELLCVSCDPSGEPPSGEVPVFTKPIANASVNGGSSPYLNTPISANGRYVFFTSPDALVPQDSNGRDDAYVYDTEKGEARLLSSGQCNCDSIFMTASPSGRDAFFTTHQQLVRMDTDNLSDLYDARVGGGIAAQNALPPNQCQGDACQATPSVPNLQTPNSAGFSGPDNPLNHKAKKHRAKKRHHKARKRRRARREAAARSKARADKTGRTSK